LAERKKEPLTVEIVDEREVEVSPRLGERIKVIRVTVRYPTGHYRTFDIDKDKYSEEVLKDLIMAEWEKIKARKAPRRITL